MSSYNSTPGYTSKGWHDKSAGNPPPSTQSLPQHLPMVPVLAGRGDSTPAILGGSDLTAKHGTEFLNSTSKYFTHSNLFLEGFNRNGNLALVKRFTLPGSARAATGIALEIVECEQEQYKRLSNGKYELDINGDRISTGGPKLAGHKLRWVRYNLNAEDIGKAVVKAGSLVGDVAAVSKVYPIFEGVLPAEGDFGNLNGLRFYGPTNSDRKGNDEDFIRTYGQYVYRLQFVEAADSVSTPKPLPTLFGSTSVDFCLGRNVLNESTEQIMSYDAKIPEAYLDQNSSWNKPMPMEMEFYDENIATVLEQLYALEGEANQDVSDAFELNIANGVDVDDVPYYTFNVVGPSGGGLYLSSSTNIMASGGLDYVPELDKNGKEISMELMFDKEVREYYNDLAVNEAHELRDRPKFPWRHLYDTGFTLPTKYALIDTMSVFGDVNVSAATQDVNDTRNSLDAEYSIGTALVTRFQMHPESTDYGTPSTRGVAMMQSGFIPNSKYKRLVPQLYALAMKRSLFAGAANGILKGEKAYDLASNNRVEELTGINHTHVPSSMRKQIWEAGIAYSQTEDQENVFFPAIQSVHRDKTSVLLSDIVVNICCHITSKQHDVWRQFSGNSKYTPDQIKDKAAKYYASLVPSTIFDNRVIIKIDVAQTKTQEELGYAYTPTVRVYANNMALVFDYELETYRISDSEVSA